MSSRDVFAIFRPDGQITAVDASDTAEADLKRSLAARPEPGHFVEALCRFHDRPASRCPTCDTRRACTDCEYAVRHCPQHR